jgi:hypothetical protein
MANDRSEPPPNGLCNQKNKICEGADRPTMPPTGVLCIRHRPCLENARAWRMPTLAECPHLENEGRRQSRLRFIQGYKTGQVVVEHRSVRCRPPWVGARRRCQGGQ